MARVGGGRRCTDFPANILGAEHGRCFGEQGLEAAARVGGAGKVHSPIILAARAGELHKVALNHKP